MYNAITLHMPMGRTPPPWAPLEPDWLRVVFEDAGAGVVLAGSDARLRYANQAFCDLIGWEPDGVAGLNFAEITHPEDLNQELDLLQEMVSGVRDHYSIEKRYLVRGGGVRWVHAAISCHRDRTSSQPCFIGVVHDLEQIRRKEQRLVESNQAKDRLIDILAHDLRNPCNAIIGLCEMLQADLRQGRVADAERFVHMIADSAQASMALLGNLLDWSRSQSGRLMVHPGVVDLRPVCLEVVDLTGPMALAKRIHVSLEVPAGLQTFTDGNMLRTVIRNLVCNAIKFTPTGGLVRLLAQEQRCGAVLTVLDNGVGIDAQRLAQLNHQGNLRSTPGTASEAGRPGLDALHGVQPPHGLPHVAEQPSRLRHGGPAGAAACPGTPLQRGVRGRLPRLLSPGPLTSRTGWGQVRG